MKKILGLVCCLLALSATAQTSRVFSVTTVSNMFYTNNVMWTNILNNSQSNSTFVASNMFWAYTNSLTFNTNLAVIVPNSLTNWIQVTNSVVVGVTNQQP